MKVKKSDVAILTVRWQTAVANLAVEIKRPVKTSAVIKTANRIPKMFRKEIETHYTDITSIFYVMCSIVSTSYNHSGRTTYTEKGRKDSQRNDTGLYEKLLNTNTLFSLEQR